ncbi:MAG: nuclease-related domain-containing protein [Telluria sp.]
MIYKDCDNKEPIVTILERMLALAGPDKRALIERQLRTMRAGIKGEREAAWLIDVYLKDATRTAVIHDLRLDLGDGQVAQIDHLLIHRTRRFYVLETKPFSHGVKITDEGEFLRWNEAGKSWESMPSPLVQNERNVPVLRRTLETMGLGDCPIESWVLVAPNARIDRPRKYDTWRVVKADQFIEKMNKALENGPAHGALDDLLRTGLYDSIGDIANKLIALHSPATTDYMARFGVVPEAQPAAR